MKTRQKLKYDFNFATELLSFEFDYIPSYIVSIMLCFVIFLFTKTNDPFAWENGGYLFLTANLVPAMIVGIASFLQIKNFHDIYKVFSLGLMDHLTLNNLFAFWNLTTIYNFMLHLIITIFITDINSSSRPTSLLVLIFYSVTFYTNVDSIPSFLLQIFYVFSFLLTNYETTEQLFHKRCLIHVLFFLLSNSANIDHVKLLTILKDKDNLFFCIGYTILIITVLFLWSKIKSFLIVFLKVNILFTISYFVLFDTKKYQATFFFACIFLMCSFLFYCFAEHLKRPSDYYPPRHQSITDFFFHSFIQQLSPYTSYVEGNAMVRCRRSLLSPYSNDNSFIVLPLEIYFNIQCLCILSKRAINKGVTLNIVEESLPMPVSVEIFIKIKEYLIFSKHKLAIETFEAIDKVITHYADSFSALIYLWANQMEWAGDHELQFYDPNDFGGGIGAEFPEFGTGTT